MRRSLHIEATGYAPGSWAIAPRPFDHWGQRYLGFAAEGIRECREIGSTNSDCRAYLMRMDGPVLRLTYEVEQLSTLAAPAWVWRMQNNRFTEAAPDLAAMAGELTEGAPSQSAALRRIIDQAAELFDYDHPEEKFNDGHAQVPTICGTAKGSCVDINTYILAAARSVGITGQYMAGYWIHPEKTETLDMHCWLAFAPDGKLEFWDLAHCLKWAATLGATIDEGLNPARGRRIAMSCGRGLEFDTPVGAVSISHFSEPYRLSEDGAHTRPDLRIRVEEPAGCCDQYLDHDRSVTAAE